MNAIELAEDLGARFLEEGCYESLGTLVGGAFPHGSNPTVMDFWESNDAIPALAVQSVGATEHLENNKVIVYVTKGSQRAIRSVPSEASGVQVEAIVMGKLKPWMSSSLGLFFEKNGRIACGSSCAPSRENYAGTLGALMTDGEKFYALSNNHVFAACNHTPHRMPIMAPANSDSHPNRPAPTEFAKYKGMIELRSGVPGIVETMRHDAAYAEIIDPQKVSSWQGDEENGYDTPSAVVRPRTGMRVKKFGKTTGFTEGVIESFVPAKWVLPYKSRKFSADVWFQNTWMIEGDSGTPFALAGDSGSLVVNDSGQAVGLIFGGNPQGNRAIICSLEPILAQFGNLRIVSGHGI